MVNVSEWYNPYLHKNKYDHIKKKNYNNMTRHVQKNASIWHNFYVNITDHFFTVQMQMWFWLCAGIRGILVLLQFFPIALLN